MYVWRIDLIKTEPFWRGWFSGLTELFLSCPLPKILIIAGNVYIMRGSITVSLTSAGVDRLDKEMTIAQMQGKSPPSQHL